MVAGVCGGLGRYFDVNPVLLPRRVRRARAARRRGNPDLRAPPCSSSPTRAARSRSSRRRSANHRDRPVAAASGSRSSSVAGDRPALARALLAARRLRVGAAAPRRRRRCSPLGRGSGARPTAASPPDAGGPGPRAAARGPAVAARSFPLSTGRARRARRRGRRARRALAAAASTSRGRSRSRSPR